RRGRPWQPGGKPDAIGQRIVSACTIGPHVAAEPWSAMGGFAWEDARLAEHGNDWNGRSSSGPQLPAAPDPATWLDIPSPATGGTPRALVLSDSTASEYPPEHAPREGWGMQLGAASGLEVLNRAVSGRSSASFLAEGHLDRALEELRPGDLVLIAFGHNDPKDDERFADVHLAYPAALRRMLVGARARGGIPVLLTSIERRRFEDGHAVPTHGGYPQAVRALAAEEAVPLIDLSHLALEMWEGTGRSGRRRPSCGSSPANGPASRTVSATTPTSALPGPPAWRSSSPPDCGSWACSHEHAAPGHGPALDGRRPAARPPPAGRRAEERAGA